jgi:pSer/pThr/pTyr-binding forkhead associated (FHA) protein/soluble lytic murein transglycosylase-like protein
MPRLIVRTAGRTSDAFTLDQGRVRIGRAAECEIVLDDEGVSRQHAAITCRGERCTIEDTGSRNGTFVNGGRIERAELRPGDRVRLGTHAELEFEGDAAASAEATESVFATTGARAGASRAGGRRRGAGGPGFLRETRFTLVPLEGDGPPVPLVRDVTVVGRDPGTGLQLDDDSVSRTHARLDRRGDHLVVTDLKSSNGTRVNGESIVRADLTEGDHVEFGAIGFEVARDQGLAWKRVGLVGGAVGALVVAIVAVMSLADWMGERAAVSETERRLRAQVLYSVQRGVEAYRRNDLDYARSYLLYAGDLLLISGLAPPGTSLDRPGELFRGIVGELPREERDFDFERALDPRAAAAALERLEGLSDREFVTRQIKRIAIELGQDENVPEGFDDQVWDYLQENVRYPGKFQTTLDRSVRIQPRLREILEQAHLPEVFCFVAWTESDLDPRAVSAAQARGLWQFVESSGRFYGLHIDPAHGIDERLDVVKSTHAATRYIGNLIKTFGREQFMCALASYNRGEGGVRRAMEKIPDPMMQSSKKYWYMVENELLPRETSEYVSRIFTAYILAADPERFGFRRP